MAEYTKYVDEVQTQTLNAFEQFTKSQEEVLAAVKEAVVAVQEEIPSPAQTVENTFAFAMRILDFQKRYTLKLVDALTPAKA